MREGLKWEDGFPSYRPKDLPKVNALRRVNSMVGRDEVIPDEASVGFSTSESAHDEPRSCLNCPFYRETIGRCVLHSNTVKIYKFTKGAEDGNAIEYWPVCIYWVYGTPGSITSHIVDLDPDASGLCWVNAPKIGLERSGTNCGGGNDGDDCDYYDISGSQSKFDSPTGKCRVLKKTVGNGDCCNFWSDDDLVSWRVAATWLKDKP